MKKFIEDFKKFALKGNVVDMAVGVIIGGAFNKIVTSLVNDVVMPALSVLIGNKNLADMQYVVDASNPDAEAQKPAPKQSNEEVLLTEIRDLLKEKNN